MPRQRSYQDMHGMRKLNSTERRALRAKLLAQYNGMCQLCGTRIWLDARPRHPMSFSFDHIVALADGGKTVRSNLQPAHVSCNKAKGSIAGGSSAMVKSGPRLAYSSTSSNF